MSGDGSDHDEPPPPQRKTRGSTKLSQVIARVSEQQQREHLDLDENGLPDGPNASTFSSFLGAVARNRINILKQEWKQVDQLEKDSSWRDVLVWTNINIVITYISVCI